MNNKIIAPIQIGSEYNTSQRYFQVIHADIDINGMTNYLIFVWGEKCHRVVEMSEQDALCMLNFAMYPEDTEELPEYGYKVTAIWPDDCEFDKHKELKYTEIGPVDCTTGEIYNWLP